MEVVPFLLVPSILFLAKCASCAPAFRPTTDPRETRLSRACHRVPRATACYVDFSGRVVISAAADSKSGHLAEQVGSRVDDEGLGSLGIRPAQMQILRPALLVPEKPRLWLVRLKFDFMAMTGHDDQAMRHIGAPSQR